LQFAKVQLEPLSVLEQVVEPRASVLETNASIGVVGVIYASVLKILGEGKAAEEVVREAAVGLAYLGNGLQIINLIDAVAALVEARISTTTL
jgi:hypothetical protein